MSGKKVHPCKFITTHVNSIPCIIIRYYTCRYDLFSKHTNLLTSILMLSHRHFAHYVSQHCIIKGYKTIYDSLENYKIMKFIVSISCYTTNFSLLNFGWVLYIRENTNKVIKLVPKNTLILIMCYNNLHMYSVLKVHRLAVKWIFIQHVSRLPFRKFCRYRFIHFIIMSSNKYIFVNCDCYHSIYATNPHIVTLLVTYEVLLILIYWKRRRLGQASKETNVEKVGGVGIIQQMVHHHYGFRIVVNF